MERMFIPLAQAFAKRMGLVFASLIQVDLHKYVDQGHEAVTLHVECLGLCPKHGKAICK